MSVTAVALTIEGAHDAGKQGLALWVSPAMHDRARQAGMNTSRMRVSPSIPT